jgi:WD40 repeat protein
VVSSLAARRVETLRLAALTNLYASDMRLAQQAIAESKFGSATELLERHRPRLGDPDLRGFEWRHFWDQCQGDEAATLGSHSNQAQRALFSPDGRLVATASTKVLVWDTATRRLRHVFLCRDFVRALAFSPDGQHLAVAEQAGGLRGFDLTTGLEVANRIKAGPAPFALRWSAPDSRVEFWAQGRRATWDWSAGDLIDPVGLPTVSSRDAVSDSGVFISLQRAPWRLTVWQSNTLLAEFPAEGPALATAVSADGRRFALGEFSGTLSLFALTPAGRTNRFPAHRGLINALVFSPQGERVASGGVDQIIRLWDTSSGRPLNVLRGHRHPIWSLAFSPDGDWLVSGDAAGVVKMWPTRINRHDMTVPGSGTATLATDGGAWAFVGTNGGRWFRALSPDTDGQVLPGDLKQATQLAGVAANRLLWVDANGVPRLEEADRSVARVRLPPAIAPNTGCLSPNGQFLLYQPPGGKSQSIWDLTAGQLAWEHAPRATRERLLAISGDSRLVVAGDTAGRLRVIELGTGRELRTIQAHVNAAYAADFSPDGARMVSAGHDGLVKLWAIDSGRLLGEFRSTADAYWTVAITPDGSRIAAGTSESSIVLWDAMSRQEVATFQLGGALAPVEGLLRFTPDGRALLLNTIGSLRQWAAPRLSGP